MPKQYEAIRDNLIREGVAAKSAREQAAKIYNSKHKSNKVTGKHKKGGK